MKIGTFAHLTFNNHKKWLVLASILILVFLGHELYFKSTSRNVPYHNQMQSSPDPWPTSSLGSEDFGLDWNLEETLKSLDQSDSRLIKYTRIKYLTPPSKLPYHDVGRVTPDEFSAVVADMFQNKRNGIFIEAGANEGVRRSHTLYLEKHLNWTGLLVECNPNLIPKLKSLHRKAWIASVCLAPGTKPGMLNFSVPSNWSYSGTFGKEWNIWGKPTKWFQLEVETMPLFTLLAAIGWTEIDYFSFDIEGSELAVLKGFPFDRVIFKLLIIEIYFYDAKQKKELDELLRANNYHFVGDFSINKIYAHGSVKDKLNLERFLKGW